MKNFLLLTLSLLLSVGLAQARNTPTDTVQMYTQGSAPGSPLAGSVYTYFLTGDGFPYWKNSSGNVFGYLYSANALTQYGLLVGDGTRSPSVLSAGSNNTVLVGNTGGNPSFRQILNADVDAATDIDATKIQEANGASNGGVLTTAAQDIGGEKRLLNALGMKHVSTPANPSAGHMKVYCKSDDKCYKLNSSGDESELGAGGGGGSGGINFITLDSSFLPNKQESSNFENTIGEFTAFADTASATPTDLTGGSPTVTCTRTTSTPLNGAGSLLVTKDAADRQGEGCSAPFYVPPGYRGKQAEIMFPISISGSVVAGDFQVYVYDVTNSQLITPFNKELLGNQIHARFDIPATMAQGRLGFYFASTSAAAVTAKIDDIFAGFKDATYGFHGTEPITVTPTSSLSTNVTHTGKYRRLGDAMEYRFQLTFTGASDNVTWTEDIPSGFTIDTSRLPNVSNETHLGWCRLESQGSFYAVQILYNSSTSLAFRYQQTASGSNPIAVKADGAINGASIFANGDSVDCVTDLLPISGWSSGVTMAESSSFNISNIIANGTRVTTAPAKLGEYRALIKDNAARTFSDNAPGSAPNGTDGMRIYGTNGTGAGTSGQTNRWEFFVGKNKVVKPLFYSSSGKSGRLETDYMLYATDGVESGISTSYDTTTGIYTVALPVFGSSTTRYVGRSRSSGTAATSDATSGYFDLLVSENALAVGYQSPRSEVTVDSGNGYGSTNTHIRRYSNTRKSVGQAITYADSSTAGGSFTINEAGIYSISRHDGHSTQSNYIGITVNDSAMTTAVASLTYAQGLRAAFGGAQTGVATWVGWTGYLNAGDIVRAHDASSGACDFSDAKSMLTIVKVSN